MTTLLHEADIWTGAQFVEATKLRQDEQPQYCKCLCMTK